MKPAPAHGRYRNTQGPSSRYERNSRSLLTTDYFNHFNEVVMMFSMVGDVPEVLDDIDTWDFKSYREHFMESGLGFAPLAIECYEAAPTETRERFEKIATQMSMLIVETRIRLRQTLEEGNMDKFKDMAMPTFFRAARHDRRWWRDCSWLYPIHGSSKIDDMFA